MAHDEKHEHAKHDDKRDLSERRHALQKALDGVAKAAREIAERRAREKAPELFR